MTNISTNKNQKVHGASKYHTDFSFIFSLYYFSPSKGQKHIFAVDD